jgi:hypothetical protein
VKLEPRDGCAMHVPQDARSYAGHHDNCNLKQGHGLTVDNTRVQTKDVNDIPLVTRPYRVVHLKVNEGDELVLVQPDTRMHVNRSFSNVARGELELESAGYRHGMASVLACSLSTDMASLPKEIPHTRRLHSGRTPTQGAEESHRPQGPHHYSPFRSLFIMQETISIMTAPVMINLHSDASKFSP